MTPAQMAATLDEVDRVTRETLRWAVSPHEAPMIDGCGCTDKRCTNSSHTYAPRRS